MKRLKLIGLMGLLFLTSSLEAQKVTELSEGVKYRYDIPTPTLLYPAGLVHVGFIGNKEVVRVGVEDYRVNEGKDVVVNDLKSTLNINKADPLGFIFKLDEVILLSADNTKETAPISIQLLDENLKSKTQPVQIGDLSIVLNGTESGFKSDNRKIELSAYWNKNTGNILVYCHVLSNKNNAITSVFGKSATPYIKLILLDANFNVLSTYEEEAADNESKILAISPCVEDNGDALSYVINSKKTSLNSIQVVHLAKDNDTELIDILPDNSIIMSYKISSNAVNDKVAISILSIKEEEKWNKCDLGVYYYNLKTNDIDRFTYAFNIKTLGSSSMLDLGGLSVFDIEMLEDGSALFYFDVANRIVTSEGRDYINTYGMVYMKIDATGDVDWTTTVDSYNYTYRALYNMDKCVRYYNSDGNLEVIFNAPDKYIKNNVYKLIRNRNSRPYAISNRKNNSLPVKATIDMSTGAVRYKVLTFGGKNYNRFLFSGAQELETPGKYIMRLFLDKKDYNAIVDFTK